MGEDNLLILDSGNFEAEVIRSEIPVLVDFWAEWCGPCKMLAPVLEDLAGEYKGKVKLAKVNIDDQGELAIKYSIQSIPTLLLFKDGEIRAQHVGAKSKSVLKQSLDSVAA